MLLRNPVSLVYDLPPAVPACGLYRQHSQSCSGKGRVLVSGFRREEEVRPFARVRLWPVREVSPLAEALFDQDFPCVKLQGPPGPSLASLQYCLSPGKKVVQGGEALVDQGQFDSLFDAAEDFELALPTAEEALVGWQCRFGSKLHGLAHDFCPGRKACKPSRRNLLRIEPAGSADGGMRREEPRVGRRPQDRAAGLHGADTIFN